MFLKQLQILGFKSFADNTLLKFEPGLTAVVGPNGCGKSNVSDAIRWVLGEQSTKMLRASKMEDVIFNGTESRKALGMAEVSLTFTGLSTVSTSQFAAYDEVKVTRRLFRSGESEYLINKMPCRLRDVVDLFLDTGIDTKSLSVIEQAQINSLINSKPEQRRVFIENVAGIVKYNSRKAEALRKLQASGENLTRINDIIGEVKRQINSLNRQAKKAERYKKYKAELETDSLKKFSFEYNSLQQELAGLSKEDNSLNDREIELSLKDSTLKNRIEEKKIEFTERNKTVTGSRQELSEIDNRIGRNEDKIGMLNTQIDDLKDKRVKTEREIKELNEKLTLASAEIENQRDRGDEYAEEMDRNENDYCNKKEELEGLIKIFNEGQRQLEYLEKNIVEGVSRISQRNNVVTSLKTRLEIVKKNMKKLRVEEEEARQHLILSRSKLKDMTSGLDELQDRLGGIKNLRETVYSDTLSNKTALEECDERILSLNHELTSRQGILSSLVEMQKNYEGFEEGVKTVLKSHNSGELTGVHGVVVDMVETSERFETAIESVLGERLQSIIVDSHNDSIKALHHLKKESSGRSSFIPLHPRESIREFQGINGDAGIIDRAVNLITYNEKYKNVLELLIGDVVIATDFDAAFNLWNKNSHSFTIVTLEGDIIKPCGTIKGGSHGNKEAGLLKKKRYMAEIEEEVSSLQDRLYKVKGERERLYEKKMNFENKKEELDETFHQEALKISNKEKDIQQVKEEILRHENRLETHIFENKNLLTEENEITEEIMNHESELIELHKKKENLESNIKEGKDRLKGLQERLDDFKEEVTKLEVHLASIRGKHENILIDIERLLNHNEDIDSAIEARQKEKNEAETKKAEFSDLIKEIEDSILKLTESRDVLKEEITRGDENLHVQDTALKELIKESGEIEKILKQVKEEKNRIALKKSEKEIQLKYGIEKVTQEFNITVEDATGMFRDEGIDITAIDERIAELRAAIIKLGDVNLSALEEYEGLTERYTFMTEQTDDLNKSIQSLHEVINKINRTTKKMFAETFEQVKKNFSNVFRKMFKGGRAELSLTNPNDILESGVEIMVQPPGKKYQNMNLFSAGEKAMTSIALIFSLFMVKPSPFCLLDEIDAPLDEANIVRFRNMLMEMSDKTQFITITHNQKTMSFADTLYGVTMEEGGISKVVSVDLKNKDFFKYQDGISN